MSYRFGFGSVPALMGLLLLPACGDDSDDTGGPGGAAGSVIAVGGASTGGGSGGGGVGGGSSGGGAGAGAGDGGAGSHTGGALGSAGNAAGSENGSAGEAGSENGGAGAEAGGAASGGAASGGAASGGAASGGAAGASSGAGGEDSGSAGAGGDGGDERFTNCPSADDYAGDSSWPHTLEVTDEAIYCATFNETRTLKEELAAKALLRVTPGSYRLPDADTAGLGLPLCVAFGQEGMAVAAAPGAMTYQAGTYADIVTHRYRFVEHLPDPERRIEASLSVGLLAGQMPGMLVDGSAPDAFDESAPSATFTLCQGASEDCVVDRLFGSCTHENATLHLHEVELDTGNVLLELRIGSSFAGTEPGAFVRASGSFRGTAFDQQDYFKLVYHPTHHHFERYFAVLFDEPIGGVCGVEIGGLEPFDDYAEDDAYAVDCELNRLQPLSVVRYVHRVAD